MLSVGYDERSGIVTTTAEGLSTAADFDGYLPVLDGFLAKSLARHGRWLHLVDASANPVQSKDSADHITSEWNARPREDGYTAYVLQSALAKMQIQRMRTNLNKEFFADIASARIWLLDKGAGNRPAEAHR